MLVVYGASIGRGGATLIKLALAGAATTAPMQSVTNAVLLTSPRTLDEMRFWHVGLLVGRDMEIFLQVAPFLLMGIVVALATGRLLDGLSMGEDVARSLGKDVGRSRIIAGLAGDGAATATAGPITFVGRAAPSSRHHRPQLLLELALFDGDCAHPAARRRCGGPSRPLSSTSATRSRCWIC